MRAGLSEPWQRGRRLDDGRTAGHDRTRQGQAKRCTGTCTRTPSPARKHRSAPRDEQRLPLWQTLRDHPLPVLNEHAVRAGTGILFALAFLVGLTIRILVNPRYASSLVFGQWAVRHLPA